MRLDGLDTARFMAFCGMVLVNFRLATETTSDGTLPSLITDALEGRAAALFVVLAGVGLSLGRASIPDVLARAIVLMTLGLANLTIFDADILHFYAVYFVFALPFLTCSSRRLWLAILTLPILTLLSHLVINYDSRWSWDTLTYEGFWTPGGFSLHTLFNGWHPVFPWLSFLLLGLWLGRLDLGRRQLQIQLLLFGALGAVLGALPQYFITDPDLRSLFDVSMIPPGPTYVLAAGGSALAAIGVILLCQPLLIKMRVSAAFTLPGRQALSLYILHILAGMGALEGLGYIGGATALSAVEVFLVSVGFCVLCSVYAMIWQRWFRLGPLEAALKNLVTLMSPALARFSPKRGAAPPT